jgi:transposase
VIDLLWVGIEACASAHHWSREPQALGHKVRLTPPAYVKPYAKRQKNDAADAEAICQAVTTANMRFVPTKTPEQQSGPVTSPSSVHSSATAAINAIRAILPISGSLHRSGHHGVEEFLNVIADPNDMPRHCLIGISGR